MKVVPCTIGEARAFVEQHHRHHLPPRSGLFAVAVAEECVRVVRVADGIDRRRRSLGRVRGVAIVGRAVARELDADDFTAEITRVATDGAEQACSMLYGACWRAARALGYRRLVTYTLATELGTSLRASGWRVVAKVSGRSWSCPSRPRVDLHPTQDKLRWEACSVVHFTENKR